MGRDGTDLVHVCARERAWLHEGVDTVVDELRALEAHHGCLGELACHEGVAGCSGGLSGRKGYAQGEERDEHGEGVVEQQTDK